jgi:hypothetical protein
METTYINGTVTLVSVADGATSLYFSPDGGIIGAGAQGAVQKAGFAFLAEAQASRELMQPTREAPLPPLGAVRFYLRTPARLLTAERSEEDLGEQRSSLSPLFNAAYRVIAQIRLAGLASV